MAKVVSFGEARERLRGQKNLPTQTELIEECKLHFFRRLVIDYGGEENGEQLLDSEDKDSEQQEDIKRKMRYVCSAISEYVQLHFVKAHGFFAIEDDAFENLYEEITQHLNDVLEADPEFEYPSQSISLVSDNLKTSLRLSLQKLTVKTDFFDKPFLRSNLEDDDKPTNLKLIDAVIDRFYEAYGITRPTKEELLSIEVDPFLDEEDNSKQDFFEATNTDIQERIEEYVRSLFAKASLQFTFDELELQGIFEEIHLDLERLRDDYLITGIPNNLTPTDIENQLNDCANAACHKLLNCTSEIFQPPANVKSL